MKETIVRTAKHRVSLFAYVGVINTLFDILLLNMLRVATHTQSSETTKLIALNIISVGTTAMLSFYLNRRYVFKSHDTHNRMFMPFLFITLSGIFLIQSLIIAFSLNYFGSIAQLLNDLAVSLQLPVIRNFSFNFYEANLAKILSTFGSMIWNYTWYKKIIFTAAKRTD